MSDIATKLAYLNETKSLIKQAIIDKGVSISDTDSFRSYADKITSIEGGTTPSPVATDDVCRKNLCYWMDAIDNKGIKGIDGTRNTTAGNWWSKSGFSYFAPYNGTATTTWNKDSVTYNSSYRGVKEVTPFMYSYKADLLEATYEIAFSMNSYPSSDASHIIGNNESGGSRIYVGTTGNIATNCFVNSTLTATYDPITQKLPLNQKVYVCARIKQGIISLYSTQGGIISSSEFTGILDSLFMASVTVGYDGNATGIYQSRQSDINVSSFRIYNRYITDEEMLANCKYEVNRFNIPEYRILTINSNVEGATVTLTADGYTQTDNYIKVLKGTEVTYSVSADGYTTQTGTITVNDTQTVDITL